MTDPVADGPDLGKLIKLLKMTTSANDAEALAASRLANRELRKFGGDWEALLRGKVTIIEDPFTRIDRPPPRREAAPSPPRPPQPQAPPKPAWAPPRPPRPQPAPPSQPYSFGSGYSPPAAGPNPEVRRNAFTKNCYDCGTRVDDLKGWSIKPDAHYSWLTFCTPCFQRHYPTLYNPKAYTTQSGKPTARMRPKKPGLDDILNQI